MTKTRKSCLMNILDWLLSQVENQYNVTPSSYTFVFGFKNECNLEELDS